MEEVVPLVVVEREVGVEAARQVGTVREGQLVVVEVEEAQLVKAARLVAVDQLAMVEEDQLAAVLLVERALLAMGVVVAAQREEADHLQTLQVRLLPQLPL